MDPFASIIKFCIPTAEMEAQFANCPYARESEILALATWTAVDQQSSNPNRSPERVEVVVLDEESDRQTEAIVIDEEDISKISGSGNKPKARHADADTDVDVDGGCKRRRVRQRGDICGKKRDLPAWLKGKGKIAPSPSTLLKSMEKDVVVENENEKEKRIEKEVVVEKEKEKEECSRSLKRKEKEVAVHKDGGLFELMDILEVLFGDVGSCGDEDDDDKYVDLILIAREMGIEFHRPRWWPPADADADVDEPELWKF